MDSIRRFDIKTQRSIVIQKYRNISSNRKYIRNILWEKIAIKIEEKYPKELSDIEAIRNGDYESK